METILTYDYTTFEYILLVIILYTIQLLITIILINILNNIDNTYGKTNLHYILPIISVIAYSLVLLNESRIRHIEPFINKVCNSLFKK